MVARLVVVMPCIVPPLGCVRPHAALVCTPVVALHHPAQRLKPLLRWFNAVVAITLIYDY
ncbi:MAG: hypothetical protein ABS45_07425 [Comamonas sp. SCN 65-56]|nr:MAG: hypothetical protein ABS45_07425 [Comamonas sp. SCN 65-56]